MLAKIITIKRTKDLNYFSLCALNLFNTRVSQFELNYWNKWTFPWHSNLLRCTCTCHFAVCKIIILQIVQTSQLKYGELIELWGYRLYAVFAKKIGDMVQKKKRKRWRQKKKKICFLCLTRMTILPPTDKLKMMLNKLKEFHQKFTQQYSWTSSARPITALLPQLTD